MTFRILLSKVVGKQKENRRLKFHFQCSRKTENENGILKIPFTDDVGNRKTKLEVQIPFSYFAGKRLALRYTHLHALYSLTTFLSYFVLL